MICFAAIALHADVVGLGRLDVNARITFG